eukprot:gene11887-15125_t
MQVTPSIFKAYDIRGVTPTALNEDLAEALGLAFGTQAMKLGEKSVAVGRDGRLSGPALSAALIGASLTHAAPVAAPNLTLEQVFRAESYRGEAARDAGFSHSGRYLAYAWAPYREPGGDLHVFDNKTGKTFRLTSPALMAAYDAPEDLERFEKKLKQRNSETAERQAREEAYAAYLRGEKVDLEQWEKAAIEELKKEFAEKKAKDE